MFTNTLLSRLRAETLGCASQIHFNNAGAALLADPVFAAVETHLNLERKIGGYAAEAEAKDKIASFYPAMARLINARPNEIAFVANHTRAWEMGLRALEWNAGDRLLIHDSAYSSNYLAFLHLVQTKGIILDRMPSGAEGLVDLAALPTLVTPHTKAIALTHMPTFDGTIQPAAAIGNFAKAHGLFYILDACQSVGQHKIDVQEIGCDILASTGRKWLRGPRGTGFLYVASKALSALTPPLIDNISAVQKGEDSFEWAEGAKRFETYERHVAGQIGLGVAAEYAQAIGLENIQNRVEFLGQKLRATLRNVNGVRLLEQGDNLSGIVTFQCQCPSQKPIIEKLWADHIAVSFVSPEFAFFKFKDQNITGAIRASIHYYNTEDEIERFCQSLSKVLSHSKIS